ncbi:hypothetical protein [Pseudonocardia sp. TRM90224]|uniref:hypothetical protein n=1 Tax=Pseudonocardia sp. TRM90224 TaxID=2812678 RepID=UPI001E297F0A|nr:hypothetical protein [Pseudonocardia sp. TRM90224]
MSYRTRPIRFLELWPVDGWRVKIYGITAVGERPDPELVTAAKAVARDRLPTPTDGGRHGIAFLTVHQGAQSAWALVDWWVDGHLLHHHLYGSGDPSSFDLRPVTDGLTACTWELAVIGFERQVWLDTVYAADEPDIDAYLNTRLEADA